jgi:hypothetical protein
MGMEGFTARLFQDGGGLDRWVSGLISRAARHTSWAEPQTCYLGM